MARYRMAINASVCITVEADDEAAAKALAEEAVDRAVDDLEGITLDRAGGFSPDEEPRLYFFPQGLKEITVEDVEGEGTMGPAVLTVKDRQALKDRFWSWLDPSVKGYSKQLEHLLDTLTDEQLTQFVTARVGEDGDDEEGEGNDP